MPSPKFINSLVSGFDYWLERTRLMDEVRIADIDADRQNLFRIIQIGIGIAPAWPGVAEVAINIMPLVNRRMYRSEWLPLLQKLAATCPAENLSLKFQLLIQLGRTQRLERQLELATDTLKNAEALAQELGTPGALAQARYNLGRCYYDKHAFKDAEDYCRLALDILSGIEDADQFLVAWSLITIGSSYSARGDFDIAADYLARGVEIGRGLGQPTMLARSLVDQAHNLMSAGQLNQAVGYLKEAEDLLIPTSDEMDKTLIGINLGSIYFQQGRWSAAEEVFRRAYSPYLRQSGNIHYQGFLTSNLGNVLLKLERLTEAEAYMRQSIELWRHLDDNLNLANAVGSLGEIMLAQGEKAKALPLLDEALLLLVNYPDHPFAQELTELFEEARTEALNLKIV